MGKNFSHKKNVPLVTTGASMKKPIINILIRIFIILLPLVIGLIIINIINDIHVKKIIDILLMPVMLMGQAVFLFKGKVFAGNWYSRRECTIWGIFYLFLAIIVFIVLFNRESPPRTAGY
jgi:hypothetical protein